MYDFVDDQISPACFNRSYIAWWDSYADRKALTMLRNFTPAMRNAAKKISKCSECVTKKNLICQMILCELPRRRLNVNIFR